MREMRKIALIITMGVVMWLLPFFNISVNATGFNYSANPSVVLADIVTSDSGTIKGVLSDINKDIGLGIEFVSYKDDNITDLYIYFNLQEYNELSSENKQMVMDVCLTKIMNSSISSANRNKIYNFISKCDEPVSSLVRQLSSDVKVDFVGAYKWIRATLIGLGKILGIAAIVLTGLFTLSILLDIFFITIPTFQAMILKLHDLQKGKDSKKADRVWLVSREAHKALLKTAEDDSNTFINWLRFRVPTLILASVCILYLIAGNIFDLGANIIDYFDGLFSVLSQK